jgi:hypothetical protein
MRRRFAVVTVLSLLSAGAAWAQAPAVQPRSDSPYTETLYATDHHMGFSIRITVLRWLGGVDVARERDTKAAEKEGWWGENVPQVSPESLRASHSDR